MFLLTSSDNHESVVMTHACVHTRSNSISVISYWVSCDVINFSGVNSKSRHRHWSELNVHCMCRPRVS